MSRFVMSKIFSAIKYEFTICLLVLMQIAFIYHFALHLKCAAHLKMIEIESTIYINNFSYFVSLST